jgi:hypothetical protein
MADMRVVVQGFKQSEADQTRETRKSKQKCSELQLDIKALRERATQNK